MYKYVKYEMKIGRGRQTKYRSDMLKKKSVCYTAYSRCGKPYSNKKVHHKNTSSSPRKGTINARSAIERLSTKYSENTAAAVREELWMVNRRKWN